MSYILDALKKAERERGAAQVPTLMTVHDSPRESSSARFWILSACALLAASALVWLIVSLTMDKKTSRPAVSLLKEVDVIQAEPVPETVPSIAPSGEPPKPVMPSGNEPLRAAPTAAKSPSARIPQVELPGKLPSPDASHTAIPKAPAPESSVSGARTVSTQAAPKAAAAAADSASKPASLQQAMAELNMTILSYADEKSERMAFINDRKYVEGDLVDGLYLVESITAEGVVLSYQGERAMLRPKTE